MYTNIEDVVRKYKELGIDKQINYDKFYLYSIVTHSTAIEGSTITELENQMLLDEGLSINGKSIVEQLMNIDLNLAYKKAKRLAKDHTPITIELLIELASIVMKNTGQEYKTALGNFSSSKGELRLLNVTAGVGGKSYMNYDKIKVKLKEFCDNINEERARFSSKNLTQLYNISFDAHYNLVTIHPWADGNGRMARLIMNMLQFECGLIPTKILKEDKIEYIEALTQTREKEDISIFRTFMANMMIKNLTKEIDEYSKSINKEIIIKKKPEETKKFKL